MENLKPAKTILKSLFVFLMVLFVIFGFSLILDPILDAKAAEQEMNSEIQVFKELVAVTVPDYSPITNSSEEAPSTPPETEPILPELKAAMEEYNEEIYINGQKKLVDAWSYQAEVFDLTAYGFEEKVIGIVSIPVIGVEMPLYLGASYSNLAKGMSQLSQTSMPIGGIDTNCVIAGHRGYRSAAHLRDIEGVSLGDSVFIQNPWEVLEYHVVDIKIIQPHETENILIQPGRDLVTIVTCHPYGVGSHRYILTCERHIPLDLNEAITVPEITEPDAELKWKTIFQWQDRVVITSDGTEFHSSNQSIILSQVLPWILLAITAVVLAAILVVLFSQLHKHKKPRQKK